jgi:predicted Fe-Mo cluster-binding NifX family protein
MKVAITSIGTELSSLVDCDFERSLFFIIVDIERMRVEAAANPYVNAMSGAGIQSAQFIANKAVEIVITGDCGSNAFQTLKAVAGLSGIHWTN